MDQFENLPDYYIWTPNGAETFRKELESVEIQKRFRDEVLFSVMVNKVTLQTLPLKTLKIF